jgi:hypothetical protein
MTRLSTLRRFVIAVALVVCAVPAFTGDNSKPRAPRGNVMDDVYRPFLINQIFNYYGNNGDGSYNRYSGDNEGFEFAKGSGKHVVFEDGVMWGGFHKGFSQPKIGGSNYRHGLQAGPIIAYGTAITDPVAADPSDTSNRIFRVRPDINPHTPFALVQVSLDTGEVAYISRYETYSAQDIYNQYIKDWNEWPAALGAPFQYGVDQNGTLRHAPMPYDPNLDIPGVPGADQTLWYVANDMNIARTANLTNTPPIGIEMQRTIWGYNRYGPVGQTIFLSTVLINKSGAPVDSMFLGQWSDPDVGYAGDDAIGCDTTRQIGYAYNGVPIDAVFGKAVPAVGFVLLEGPIVHSPGDSAIFRSTRRFGYRNLPMTSFNIQLPLPPFEYPLQGDSYYYLMEGLTGNSGSPIVDPTTGRQTRFVFPGDPLAHTGWVDGPPASPLADRRLILGSGPLTIAAGDTQEIVVANCVAQGGDYLQNTAILRDMAGKLRALFDNGFSVLIPPSLPPPVVTATALDGEIILSWGDPEAVARTEGTVDHGYRFEGYNVYEYSGQSGADRVLLGTYDLVDGVTTIVDTVLDPSTGVFLNNITQRGRDTGILRLLDIKQSAITHAPLVNGSRYYFAVTAYNFNPSSNSGVFSHSVESPAQVITILPHTSNPGVKYNSTVGESLAVTHSAGIATATASAAVVDPGSVHGRNYEARVVVLDSVVNPDLGFKVANPRWVLYDGDANTALTPPSKYYSFDAASQVFEGVQFGIAGQPFYIAGQELGTNTWTGPTPFNWTAVNSTPYPGNSFINSTLSPYQVASDVQMVFTAPGQGQNAYDFIRTATSGSAGAPYDGYYPQPFTVWELNPDGTHKRQIDFAFMEMAGSTYQDRVWSPGAATSGSDREYWSFITETYSPTGKAKYTPGITLGTALLADSVVWSGWYRLSDPTKPGYAPGDVWTITTRKVVNVSDVWSFSTKTLAPTYSPEAAKLDVTRINVFPNPYFGFNPMRTDPYARSVMFTHLPAKSVVRIFNLAGVLVRTLQKDDPGQFLSWDLTNERGIGVGAGMYIVFVQMPDLGITKTLKLGIIREDPRLDR